jgi:excisionase family DNA binding protein
MDSLATLARLEALETALLTSVQEIRAIRAEFQKASDRDESLDPLWTAEKLAQILGVDVAYVYSQARVGKIPSVKLGKYRRFSPVRVKKWLSRKAEA